jgi:hypothetical protein
MGRPAGRPPKPTEQKRRMGNPGKRALPVRSEVVPLRPIARALNPEPLRPLGGPGRSLWDRVWNSGAAWVSQDTDIELLQILCEQMDERAALRISVLRDGDWRERAGLRALDALVVSNLSLLGFTPTDRTRLGVAEVQAQSTLERLIADRGNR